MEFPVFSFSVGADLTLDDASSLLFPATKKGYLDIVKYLVLEAGADVNSELENPCYLACDNGNLGISLP